MARVYIGNLGDNASKREIEREFEYFGPLKDVWVARNPPGFAFCVFEDRRDAEDAIRDLDGKFICGTRVRVEMARGPTRGGRAVRLGLTEKCYECGRVGHFARDCTRKSEGRRRSRSRSPRRYRSRSRSRSPRYRRSRSVSNERKYGSHSRSRSRERERKSPSPFRERRKERSESPSASSKQEISSPKDDRNNGEAGQSPGKSRSQSPASLHDGPEES